MWNDIYSNKRYDYARWVVACSLCGMMAGGCCKRGVSDNDYGYSSHRSIAIVERKLHPMPMEAWLRLSQIDSCGKFMLYDTLVGNRIPSLFEDLFDCPDSMECSIYIESLLESVLFDIFEYSRGKYDLELKVGERSRPLMYNGEYLRDLRRMMNCD